MSKRKTVNVVEMIEWTNRRNRESTCSAEIRKGWNTALEEILHLTGNYAGFGYLTVDQVPPGQLPGVIRGATPKEVTFPDESRVFYYTHSRLKG